MAKPPERPELESFFYADGDTYAATLAPVGSTSCAPRSPKESIRVLKNNRGSEHVVYLTAKQQEIIDWAHQEFPQAIALRVKDYLLHGTRKALDTLTDSERKKLISKLKSANRHSKQKAQKIEDEWETL